MNHDLFFQYCPKIILFSADLAQVFLAQRTGEQDYDGTFTFIGGKLETTDATLEAGLKREKDEEIGPQARVRICATQSCYTALFRKKSGHSMVLPHHIAIFEGGEVMLNPAEYATYKWVSIDSLASFEPKIDNIPLAVEKALQFLPALRPDDFITI